MKLFDVTIIIEISCCGNQGYVEHTISIYANSKTDAVNKVTENISFKHFSNI